MLSLFKKKSPQRDESFDKVLEMMKLVQVQLAEHTAQIELIHRKLLKKTSKSSNTNTPETDDTGEVRPDGFDFLRSDNNLNNKTLGI